MYNLKSLQVVTKHDKIDKDSNEMMAMKQTWILIEGIRASTRPHAEKILACRRYWQLSVIGPSTEFSSSQIASLTIAWEL